MKVFQEYLDYGEEKTIEITGNYQRAIARITELYSPASGADLLVMTDDSEVVSKIRLCYAANGSAINPLFSEIHEFCPTLENVIDILSFNYVCDEVNKTGVVVISKG